MKKILYIILLTLSLGSCGSRGKCFLSPELEEVRILMSNNPQEALQKLQSMPNSMSYCDSASLCLYDLEYSVLLAEALYKNYFPQSNFDDIKAFVDRIDSEKTPNSTLIIPDYLRAKAHYYYAVGLSERDNIVDACEHYLKALEIMENIKHKTQTDDLDYEKVKFIVLIYNRLGELFLDNTCTDLALIKFRQALKYTEILEDNTFFKAIILKLIGNTYHISGNADSALYYYNKSLQTNYNLDNKLDIDKNIAKILHDKNEKNSAYSLIYNYNLDKIENINVKYAYHYTLGDMLYQDGKYDSAIYYLETCLDDSIFCNKLSFTLKLAEIYNAIGNSEKKSFYDNLSSRLSIQHINKSTDVSRLQTIYNEYKNRQYENQKNNTNTKIIILIILSAFIIIIFTIIILYIHQRNNKQLQIKTNDSIKYPDLKKSDLYYLCLLFLNINDKQISALLGITYSAIRKKRKKIYDIGLIDN